MGGFRMYDEKIVRKMRGECPICGEQEPLLMEILRGKKGCKHYEKRMKKEMQEEREYE